MEVKEAYEGQQIEARYVNYMVTRRNVGSPLSTPIFMSDVYGERTFES